MTPRGFFGDTNAPINNFYIDITGAAQNINMSSRMANVETLTI